MTDRYALVDEDGLVENVVLWDGAAPWSPPTGLTAVAAPGAVAIGWGLEDGQWLEPAPSAVGQ